MSYSTDDFIYHLIILGVLLAFGIAVGVSGYTTHAQNSCLRYGYPAADFSMDGTIYCKRQELATDIVTPLSALQLIEGMHLKPRPGQLDKIRDDRGINPP